jgi:hypothetical protein
LRQWPRHLNREGEAVQTLRLRKPESALALGQGDLAQALIADAARYRRIAEAFGGEGARAALIELASQCERAAASILAERNGRAVGSRFLPAPDAPRPVARSA